MRLLPAPLKPQAQSNAHTVLDRLGIYFIIYKRTDACNAVSISTCRPSFCPCSSGGAQCVGPPPSCTGNCCFHNHACKVDRRVVRAQFVPSLCSAQSASRNAADAGHAETAGRNAADAGPACCCRGVVFTLEKPGEERYQKGQKKHVLKWAN